MGKFPLLYGQVHKVGLLISTLLQLSRKHFTIMAEW